MSLVPHINDLHYSTVTPWVSSFTTMFVLMHDRQKDQITAFQLGSHYRSAIASYLIDSRTCCTTIESFLETMRDILLPNSVSFDRLIERTGYFGLPSPQRHSLPLVHSETRDTKDMPIAGHAMKNLLQDIA